MPTLGEIKKDVELGYKYTGAKHIWNACEMCGKERWTKICNGKPRTALCRSCNKKGKKGTESRHWKGGITISDGYVFILKPEHPRASYGGHKYIKRAVLVLEEKLGRLLRDGHEAHHKNGIRNDDNPDNLEEREHIEHLNHSNTLLYRPIRQLAKEGNIITNYHSISEASRSTNIDAGSICSVCKGRRRLAGGFQWSYSS